MAELRGAEILAEGRWNNVEFDADALDGIVDSFAALGLSGRVPLVIGHDGMSESDGQPAVGWIERVYRQGTKLIADISNIPTIVFDAIRKGLYKHVSVEILRNVRASTRVIPNVLDRVALLGATQPAVGTLKDLQQLTMARGTGLTGTRLTFKRIFTGGDDMSEIETLRVQLAQQNRTIIDMHFEACIREGKCLPREKELFFKRYADAATLEDAKVWLTSAQKPPARGPATRSTSAAHVATSEWADDEMLERVQMLRKTRKAEGEEPLDDVALTVLVLKADPALAQRYKNLYAPTE